MENKTISIHLFVCFAAEIKQQFIEDKVGFIWKQTAFRVPWRDLPRADYVTILLRHYVT